MRTFTRGMFARMCLLEIIPQAFDGYAPPLGISVAWFWDFNGKQPNQVIGFFTGAEISTNYDEICKDGDIKKEVENNRCFNLVRTIPQNEWATIVTGFNYQGSSVSMPKLHHKVKPEWDSKKVGEYQGEINETDFIKMNNERHANKMGKLMLMENKVKKTKRKGDKDLVTVTVDFITYRDAIQPES